MEKRGAYVCVCGRRGCGWGWGSSWDKEQCLWEELPPPEGRKERPRTILNLFLDLPKAGLKYSSDNF